MYELFKHKPTKGLPEIQKILESMINDKLETIDTLIIQPCATTRHLGIMANLANVKVFVCGELQSRMDTICVGFKTGNQLPRSKQWFSTEYKDPRIKEMQTSQTKKKEAKKV
jgi:hypothetical protein